MFNRQKIAAAALATLALSGIGIATASTASASKADDKYVAILEDAGIEADPVGAPKLGKGVCARIDKGEMPDEIFSGYVNKGLAPEQAAAIVAGAIISYCPEHKDLIDA